MGSINNASKYSGFAKPQKVVVSRVGRKYFYIENRYSQEERFCLETLEQAADTNYKGQVYLTEQDI